MLKKLLHIILILSGIWFTALSPLMAYEVENSSVGNNYTLIIENTGSQPLHGVAVALISSPAWVVNFTPTFVDFGNIQPTLSDTAVFSFGIAPGSDSLGGELELQITTQTGKIWKKKVLLYVVPRLVTLATQTNGSCCDISEYELYTPGDANGDEKITLIDIVYVVNYVFRGGPEPIPFFLSGDMNEDARVDLIDILLLVNYVFSSP
ncbi:MAG TPA: dockerin type I domain-containing protein [candidate division Zixibacteria bacterium]|nr:dockerin type I domain-containing protein [candidate division Zixibacteria bacterium]